jgi:hypothetical protein
LTHFYTSNRSSSKAYRKPLVAAECRIEFARKPLVAAECRIEFAKAYISHSYSWMMTTGREK